MTSLHCGRIISKFQNNPAAMTNRVMGELLEELGNRLQDECSLRHFLSLTESERRYYEANEALFGNEVNNKLPSVISDLDEAAKCFALGRYTGSVFHLMRIMEIGVQEFGTKLGVHLANETVWQKILDQANKKIRDMSPKAPDTTRYASISAHLYNVKLAWRNEVMHPKATYTADEAERVIQAVRGFMVDLVDVL